MQQLAWGSPLDLMQTLYPSNTNEDDAKEKFK